MNKTPLFSILMANYNNSKYIEEAIHSVQKQSYKKWELIIVDDASKDNSIRVIKPFLKDKRIKLIQHKTNQGCGATKRTCAKHTKGEILGFLDPDDALHKDYIKTLVNVHKNNPDYGAIYFPHYECNSNLKKEKITKWVGPIKGKSNLENYWVNAFVTFKKSIYNKTNGINPKLLKAVDRDLIYKLEEITQFKFINKPLYYYRKHEKGISQGNKVKEAYCWDILVKYNAYKRRLNTKIPNLLKKEMSDLLFSAGYFYIEKKQIIKAKPFFLRAIRLRPLYWPYIKTYIKRIIFKNDIN